MNAGIGTSRKKSAKMTPRWQRQLRREGNSLSSLVRPRLWFCAACARALPDFAVPGVRAWFFRRAGCRLAPRVSVLGRITLVGSGGIAGRLHIGEGSLIAPGVTFGLDGEITIGRNVSISPNATLYTATHALGFGSQRMSPAVTPKPIVVGDGVWIGMHSLILPGVTLGQGCVVSAGAVVTQDVPPNTLVAGNPATVQQTLPFGNR